jgi:hypothetical protein
MRITLMISVLGLGWALAESAASGQPVPTQSSFIMQLADQAIEADGAEAIADREYSRLVFASSFLNGFTHPEFNTPLPDRYPERLGQKGTQAGQAYRRANPDDLDLIVREYGYEKYEGVGVWSVDWEGNSFVPDDVGTNPVQSNARACWRISSIPSPEINEQMQRLISPEERSSGTRKRVRVVGYLSPSITYVARPGGPPGPPSNICQRTVLATNISADVPNQP